MVEEAAEKGLPFINYPKPHHQIWKEQYFRAVAQHKPTKFTDDYTQVPRGRVSWNIDKFIVLVGQWAKLPRRVLNMVYEWYDLHKVELKDNWLRMEKGEEIIEIKPLD